MKPTLDDKVHCRYQVESTGFSTKNIFWSYKQIAEYDHIENVISEEK